MNSCEETMRLRAAEILGVALDASTKEVSRAYRKLMRLHHPDITGRQDSEEVCRIQDAYETLTSMAANKTAAAWRSADTIKLARQAHRFYTEHASPDQRPTLDVWA